MSTTTAEQVKAFYSTAEIRRIFVKRLDDEMFEKVGREVATIGYPRNDDGKRAAIWQGFEWLVGYQPIGY